MFKRKLEESLLNWKNDLVHKPLIVRGARQVGKTSLIREFGRKYFENVIEINLEKNEHRELFAGVSSVEDLEKRIYFAWKVKVIPDQTLLFIDEIQELQEMLELLRFVAEERPKWHVLVAGSLLEVKIGSGWRIPVGRVDYRYLYPLTFFEYLEGSGQGELLNDLNKMDLKYEFRYANVAKKAFEQYCLLGGMPEVVADFLKFQDYDRTLAILRRLQTSYIDDVGKYSRNNQEKKYLEGIVENGASMAGKIYRYENFAGLGYKSREMSSAMIQVEKTMLCKQVPATNSTMLPLNIKYKRPKKLIWLDVGVVNLVNSTYLDLVKGRYEGAIMEQLVGQTIVASLSDELVKIAYFALDKDKGDAEVDFCFPWQGKLVAMEVKSGSNLKSRSLGNMVKLGEGRVVPIIVSWNDLGVNNGVLNIPFYLLERWREFISK